MYPKLCNYYLFAKPLVCDNAFMKFWKVRGETEKVGGREREREREIEKEREKLEKKHPYTSKSLRSLGGSWRRRRRPSSRRDSPAWRRGDSSSSGTALQQR